jgi:hypothetical protein
MNHPLIHGVYDSETFHTLRNLGIKEFSFDLRGRSLNLIPMKVLKSFLEELKDHQVFLTFENDGQEVILSFLDLVKNHSLQCGLIFRDTQTPGFYQKLALPFYWMFQPQGDWKSIFTLPNLKGVFLPIKDEEFYKTQSDFWELIEDMGLEVFIHAQSFEEAQRMNLRDELKLSIDLGPEVEKSYRLVDLEKIKKMNLWRQINENPSF